MDNMNINIRDATCIFDAVFLSYAQDVAFDVQKKKTKLLEFGGGGER